MSVLILVGVCQGGKREAQLACARSPPLLFPPHTDWQSKLERSGKSPLQDPAAIIGIVAIL